MQFYAEMLPCAAAPSASPLPLIGPPEILGAPRMIPSPTVEARARVFVDPLPHIPCTIAGEGEEVIFNPELSPMLIHQSTDDDKITLAFHDGPMFLVNVHILIMQRGRPGVRPLCSWACFSIS